jgi:DNA-binding protein YbaB
VVPAVEPSGVQRPDWSALGGMLDLTKAMRDAEQTQRKMFDVTGTAWSDDRLVKAVVGPRGQLVELDIDPRVYRTPNSRALATSILATVRSATDDAMAQTRQIIDAAMPADLRPGAVGALDLPRLLSLHDADLSRENDDEQ